MADVDINLHIGKRIRRRRRLLGLTQLQLAAAVGIRFQQIQKYECGANKVSAARLWSLASILEVPVAYFYDGLGQDDDMPDPRRGVTLAIATGLIDKLGRLSDTDRRHVIGIVDSLANKEPIAAE